MSIALRRKELTKELLLILFLLLSSLLQAGISSVYTQLDSSSDYFVYYGGFNDQKVLQCQYYDLLILDVRSITSGQIADIRNGFDDISGTDDDVIVFGYLSVGEQDGSPIQGDGTGPVYWDGENIVYQNNGYASFYLDDEDRDGEPDRDGIWNSYYVNAGDTAWWEYNEPLAENIITTHGCDGLFLDLIDTGGPNSWGIPYEWTAEGMINYVEYLRETYSGKYILANRGLFYFEPALQHFQYSDRYRQSIDGIMVESYYIIWDWNSSIGIYSTYFPYLSGHYASLINNHADQADGFDVFILDYLKLNQVNYDYLLDNAVDVVEQDQGWIFAVSTIFLDSIRYDVYHHHLVDNNSPTWEDVVGLMKCNWEGDDLVAYWNTAIDQTPPIKYHLYISEDDIDFSSEPQYPNLTPMESDVSDYKFIIERLDPEKVYNVALRASDSASPEHMDLNRKIVVVDSSSGCEVLIDGYFDDWNTTHQLDLSGDDVETEGDNPVSPSCDLVDVWVQENETTYYFSYSAAGSIDITTYFYHVMIDADNDPETGFHSDDCYIGIDMMSENGYLWKYTGTSGEWSWASIGTADYSRGIDDPSRIELGIPKSKFIGEPEYISFLFHINDLDADIDDDYAPNNYAESAYFFPESSNEIAAEGSFLPEKLKLTHIEYPNPFNSSITFQGKFNQVVSDDIQLTIFDISGRFVHQQIISSRGESEFKYTWTATRSDGEMLSSGMYLYQLKGIKENFSANGKIVFLQ